MLRFVFRFIRRYFLITVIDNSTAVLSRNYNRFVLAFSCLFGLVYGYVGFVILGDTILPMARDLCTAYYSVWSTACAIVLPWLLTMLAFQAECPGLIWMLSFHESISISLITCSLCCVYSSYGWLLSWILLLGKKLSFLFLYLFWLYFFSDKIKHSFHVFWIVFLLVSPIIAIQYHVSTPLLMYLIKI